MRNFRDTIEIRTRSSISAFSLYLAVPLNIFFAKLWPDMTDNQPD